MLASSDSSWLERTMATTKEQQTIGEMFGDLSRETRTLVQQRVRLASLELAETASRASGSAAMVAAGALIVHGGLLAICAALILGLVALGLPAWAGALVAGALICGVGCLLVRAGLAALRRQDFVPHQTIATLKEDARWLKRQM
jgi:hypothetical protein